MYIDLSHMKSGFCDRLRQITFCIAYNRLKKKNIKIIKIFEIKNKECPYYFTDLMELKGLKVFNLKRKKTKDQNIKMDPFNSSISIETCKKHNTDNLNNAKLLEEWKSTYKILIPKKKFKKKINKISKKKNLACIHSRITDKHLGFFSFLLEIPNKPNPFLTKSLCHKISLFVNTDRKGNKEPIVIISANPPRSINKNKIFI